MESAHTLRIAVCEDAPADTKRIVNHIEKSGVLSEISCFSGAGDFLRSFHAGQYDIIFMDIYMDGESAGVSVAEKIRESDKYVTLVFTTASPDHTRESYRLKAVSYLEKPVQAEDIKETLELALAKQKARPAIVITMEGGKNVDVPLDGIILFEHQGHIVNVHTAVSGILRTSQSARLDEIEKQLPSPPFLRCHRSFIVNLDYVRAIDKSTHSFALLNGGRADIQQKSRLKGFEETFQLWMIEKAGRDGR